MNADVKRPPVNPFTPGVGTTPPYLAGRSRELKSFELVAHSYPQKRQNVLLHGLRGVGKSVLLKEYAKVLRTQSSIDWLIIRNDIEPRFVKEQVFAEWLSGKLVEATETIKPSVKVRNQIKAMIGKVSYAKVGVPGGSFGEVGIANSEPLETTFATHLQSALTAVGLAASEKGAGLALLFDEAHTLTDRSDPGEYPLWSLLTSVAAVQDDERELPISLAMCGLPSLRQNVYRAKSNAERLFKQFAIANLSLKPDGDDGVSAAARAIVEPFSAIRFTNDCAEAIAKYVAGYPYFIQHFAEQLWEEAYLASIDAVDADFFADHKHAIQARLDENFFEPRVDDLTRAEYEVLLEAAELGGESFTTEALIGASRRSKNSVNVTLGRIAAKNIVYRTQQGNYSYTAPMFGEYIRRRGAKT